VAVHYANVTTQAGVIVAEEAVVRKGNGERYALQLPQPLHRGMEFDVLEKGGAWLHIQLVNGITGWIRREHAGLV
jgi:SH3-like domain-containing protein